MSIDSIIKHIVDEDIISAKKETEALLYSKLNDALEYHKTNIISDAYADAIGLASMSEKKKTDDEDDEDDEDDGDGLDPVGAEDGDIDNDGDSDDSDDYLNNRRKTVGKAIKKKKKNGDDEDEDEELDEAQYTSGKADGGGTTNPDLQNTPVPGNTPGKAASERAEARRKALLARNTRKHLANQAGHPNLGG